MGCVFRLSATFLLILPTCILGTEKPAEPEVDWDALPTGAAARLGTFRFRQDAMLCCITYSPDGKTIAAVGHDGAIWLWETATGKTRFILHGHRSEVSGLLFAPDGKTLLSTGCIIGGDLSSGDHTLRLWNVATGKEFYRWDKYWGEPFTFSPDGNGVAFAVDHDKTVRFVDIPSGKETSRIDELQGHATALVYSPNGKSLALVDWNKHPSRKKEGAEALLRLWDVAKGEWAGRFEKAAANVVFSPDGTKLVLWDKEQIVVRAADTGKKLNEHDGEKWRIAAVSFSAEGHVLALARNESGEEIRLWDMETGKDQLRHHYKTRTGRLQISADRKTLAVCFWGQYQKQSMELWDVAKGEKRFTIESGASLVAFSPDGKTLASAMPFEHTLMVWDATTGVSLTRPSHRHEIEDVTISPNGKYIATCTRSSSDDDRLRLWEAATGKELHIFKEARSATNRVVFSRDSKLLASDHFNHVVVWDIETRKRVATLEGRFLTFEGVVFAKDGQSVFTHVNDLVSPGVRQWDFLTGKSDPLPKPYQGAGSDGFALSPDGKFFAAFVTLQTVLQRDNVGNPISFGSAEEHLVVWETQSRNELFGIAKIPDIGGFPIFSPDGKILVLGGADGSIHAWKIPSGKEAFMVKGLGAAKCAVAISPDSKFVAVGSADKMVRLFDLSDGKELLRLEGHRGAVTSVAFFPDGKSLASGSKDATVLIWNLKDLKRKSKD